MHSIHSELTVLLSANEYNRRNKPRRVFPGLIASLSLGSSDEDKLPAALDDWPG